MDVVEPASDGGSWSVPIGRDVLRVDGVEALSAERPLDGGRLASPPRDQGVEGVFLPRGEMAKEILGRPVAPADRCRALEILVPKPFRELADRLVFLLKCAKGSLLRETHPHLRPDRSCNGEYPEARAPHPRVAAHSAQRPREATTYAWNRTRDLCVLGPVIGEW
jgi:hypothetical protein